MYAWNQVGVGSVGMVVSVSRVSMLVTLTVVSSRNFRSVSSCIICWFSSPSARSVLTRSMFLRTSSRNLNLLQICNSDSVVFGVLGAQVVTKFGLVCADSCPDGQVLSANNAGRVFPRHCTSILRVHCRAVLVSVVLLFLEALSHLIETIIEFFMLSCADRPVHVNPSTQIAN